MYCGSGEGNMVWAVCDTAIGHWVPNRHSSHFEAIGRIKGGYRFCDANQEETVKVEA